MPQLGDRAFDFLKLNNPPAKPRTRGVTEIRGPCYTPMGKRYLADILDTMGAYVDILKFAGGSFALMPAQAVKEIIDLCHAHDVLVSTGGFIEYVLTQGAKAVDRYIETCSRPGGVRLVYQELRRRGQPVWRPQPDCSAAMPARRHLGHEKPLGP